MKRFRRISPLLAALVFFGGAEHVWAAPPPPELLSTATTILDLPTALRLAGAQNIEVQIAREKLAETRADYQSARWQFFPWLLAGASYRRHDNLTQDVLGNIVDVHKEDYTLGPTLTSQLDLGDAVYKKLAAQQLVKAAEVGVENQRQQSLALTAQGYLELLRARAAERVAADSVKIAESYVSEVRQAVNAGLAFAGDALRAQLQIDRSRLVLRQTREQQETAVARLVQILRLPAGTSLETRDAELPRLELVSPRLTREALVARALGNRPELREGRFQAAAAFAAQRGAKYGPLYPSFNAQIFLGGLGGGRPEVGHSFGRSEDYFVSLGWRIGPGGLFDKNRVASAEARTRAADLAQTRTGDEIIRQVIESHARIQSMTDQLQINAQSMQTAEEGFRLTRARKSFSVGAVLEDVQAEQDLTRARLDYLTALSEYDKAEYALLFAIGGLSVELSSEPPAAKP